MKPKNNNIYIQTLAILLLAFTITYAQNSNPVVSNVAFSISGTTVTVTYDVSDADNANQTFTINMEVSNDGGATYNYNYGATTGDIGANITTGSKTITWQYAGNNTDVFKIKIIADDEVGDQIYYAGQIYNTVSIGTQTWLKENLNVGTMIISNGSNTNQQQTDNSIIEKYCYNNNANNCNTYGALYEWNEAMQYVTTEGTQGICPSGWHIPTEVEYQTLKAAVSNSSNALKALGQGTGSGVSNNSSGFSALVSGFRNNSTGSFSLIGNNTFFWSSTEISNNAYLMNLNRNDDIVNIYNLNKNYGFSVRCLKD